MWNIWSMILIILRKILKLSGSFQVDSISYNEVHLSDLDKNHDSVSITIWLYHLCTSWQANLMVMHAEWYSTKLQKTKTNIKYK